MRSQCAILQLHLADSCLNASADPGARTSVRCSLGYIFAGRMGVCHACVPWQLQAAGQEFQDEHQQSILACASAIRTSLGRLGTAKLAVSIEKMEPL